MFRPLLTLYHPAPVEHVPDDVELLLLTLVPLMLSIISVWLLTANIVLGNMSILQALP